MSILIEISKWLYDSILFPRAPFQAILYPRNEIEDFGENSKLALLVAGRHDPVDLEVPLPHGSRGRAGVPEADPGGF